MINFKIFHRVDPRTKLCPECKKFAVLKRSHSRNGIEKLVKFFTPLSMYRCNECGWRGYKSAYAVGKDSVKAIFNYLILFFITIYIVRFILKRFIL